MKTKQTERGFIERREIMYKPDTIALYKYFLVVTDGLSHRVISTYGPKDSSSEIEELAKMHGIVIG